MKTSRIAMVVGALLLGILSPTPSFAIPTNTVLPTVSGLTALGENLIGNRGTWTGTNVDGVVQQIQGYSYMWYRCNTTLEASCSPISGATSLNYRLVQADVGKFMRFRVIATDSTGSADKFSAATALVVAPPINLGLPVITGNLTVGSTLISTNGTWSTPNQGIFRFQWYRCPAANPTSCVLIPGAATNTYVIADSDIGMGLISEVRVFETTGIYFSTAKSSISGIVSSLPKNTALPTITGIAATGSTLTATVGTWISYPTATYTQQWQKCTSQLITSCQNIVGQTNLTYTTTMEDQNGYLRIGVTALNTIGGTIKYSEVFGPIQQPTKPVNTLAPTLSGIAKEGNTLTISQGTWTALPAPTFTYKWFRCENESLCVEISGATQSTLALTLLEGNRLVKGAVTASNSVGTTSATSQLLAIEGNFRTLIKPSIEGNLKVGAELKADPGTWVPTPDAAFNYKWQICENTSLASCADISPIESKILINKSDLGKRFRLGVAISGKSSYVFSEITETVKSSLKRVKKGSVCKKLNSKALSFKGKNLSCKRVSGKLIWG